MTASTLRSAGRALDPQLVEKAVHALEYVAQLATTGVPFIFTGGTAAQVLLASRGDAGLVRLSKDVDVLSPELGPDDWRKVTRQIAARFGGAAYEATEDPRTHGGLFIPALHFLLRYPTVFPSDTRPDIELDIVFGGNAVLTQDTPLRTAVYGPREPLTVQTPSVRCPGRRGRTSI